MEYIKINDKKYKFVIRTGEDDKFRISFNVLTKKTFGFDFEQWYQYGYWKNQFLPYSLMDGDVVVSNVSVNIMDFGVFGKPKRYIQLGTVMTDVAYRNRGLSRVIMEKIIEEWKDKCDLLYLFANDSVLDFYPKFGFDVLKQYQCTKPISKHGENGLVKKLDMTDSVYYIQDYDAVIIANFEGDTIEVLNVFCKEDISLDKMLDYLVDENIKREKLYFTPKETDSYLITPIDRKSVV